MIDWTASMQQSFEYYTVDPGTWRDVRLLDNVKSCTLTRDSETETLGSASIDVVDSIGESYIRVYLIAIQNGVREKIPLGTYMVQTPSSTFDGKMRNVTMDAYTPLLELKESLPPIGYSLRKGDNIMDAAYRICREYTRAPVIKPENHNVLAADFISDTSDTWLSFLTDLAAAAKHTFDLDEYGRIYFSPKQDAASLRPIWTYNDDNSSILYPELSMDHDLYGIPNVVEVIYSTGSSAYYAKVVNDDPDSPTSTIRRGREIIYRDTAPALPDGVMQYQIDDYATQLLRSLSTVEYTVTYKHAYCPVRVSDCVRLNYARADIPGVNAKVISQSITCEPGCPVSEKAIFTTKLWR